RHERARSCLLVFQRGHLESCEGSTKRSKDADLLQTGRMGRLIFLTGVHSYSHSGGTMMKRISTALCAALLVPLLAQAAPSGAKYTEWEKSPQAYFMTSAERGQWT